MHDVKEIDMHSLRPRTTAASVNETHTGIAGVLAA